MNIYQVIGAVAVGAVLGSAIGVCFAQYLITRRVRTLLTDLDSLQGEPESIINPLLTISKDK
jgi:cytosine/uracil/thiamine/allantoin permease